MGEMEGGWRWERRMKGWGGDGREVGRDVGGKGSEGFLFFLYGCTLILATATNTC